MNAILRHAHFACQAVRLPIASRAVAVCRQVSDDSLMDINHALGRAIAHYRKGRGLNQITVTERAKLGQGRLSRIEAGKQGVSQQGLADIASAIGVRVSDLWEWVEAEAGAAPRKATPTPVAVDTAGRDVMAAVGVLVDLLAEQMPAARAELARRLRDVQPAAGSPYLLALAEAVEAEVAGARTAPPLPPR